MATNTRYYQVHLIIPQNNVKLTVIANGDYLTMLTKWFFKTAYWVGVQMLSEHEVPAFEKCEGGMVSHVHDIIIKQLYYFLNQI